MGKFAEKALNRRQSITHDQVEHFVCSTAIGNGKHVVSMCVLDNLLYNIHLPINNCSRGNPERSMFLTE